MRHGRSRAKLKPEVGHTSLMTGKTNMVDLHETAQGMIDQWHTLRDMVTERDMIDPLSAVRFIVVDEPA